MSKLHIDSVIKSFGEKLVLSDVYLSCQKGEIVGLLGRNGSGKSTLLKIIFGSLKADRKFIKVDDKIAKGINTINYLPQNNFLPNHITVKAIINLFCCNQNAALVEENKLVTPLLSKKVKQLSGGERRMLEVILITHSIANFILIDEPFNGLTPLYKDQIKEIIKEQSANKGFIITDHDYRNVLDIATRSVLIHDGGIKEISNNEDLKYWGYIPDKSN
ncbi:MAG: ATP-binding cassette domain-containing protein [Bacteroidales bacterium]